MRVGRLVSRKKRRSDARRCVGAENAIQDISIPPLRLFPPSGGVPIFLWRNIFWARVFRGRCFCPPREAPRDGQVTGAKKSTQTRAKGAPSAIVFFVRGSRKHFIISTTARPLGMSILNDPLWGGSVQKVFTCRPQGPKPPGIFKVTGTGSGLRLPDGAYKSTILTDLWIWARRFQYSGRGRSIMCRSI
ncbi:MAG: hypothetical protein CM15mP21_4750 [Hyphomicrobiales bacterium]|nr:MAG: hypothetical protein CM15mP21_4750 [Hyphomicrobiales bacterium]